MIVKKIAAPTVQPKHKIKNKDHTALPPSMLPGKIATQNHDYSLLSSTPLSYANSNHQAYGQSTTYKRTKPPSNQSLTVKSPQHTYPPKHTHACRVPIVKSPTVHRTHPPPPPRPSIHLTIPVILASAREKSPHHLCISTTLSPVCANDPLTSCCDRCHYTSMPGPYRPCPLVFLTPARSPTRTYRAWSRVTDTVCM